MGPTSCHHRDVQEQEEVQAEDFFGAMAIEAVREALATPPAKGCLFTYNAAISACKKDKQPDTALELFEDMQRKGVEIDMISYSAASSACKRASSHQGL